MDGLTNNLIINYEELLLGKKQTTKIQPYFFRKDNEKTLRTLYTYAIEHVLGYTPEEAKLKLTEEHLKKLKLDKITDKHMPFPAGLPKSQRCFYIVHFCYPDIVPFNKKKFALQVYGEVLSGRAKAFPKNFFSVGDDGYLNSVVCLQYVLHKYYAQTKIADLYRMFGTQPSANKLLREHRLEKAVKNGAYLTPLDFFHYVLREQNRDEFLYRYYKFENDWLRYEKVKAKQAKAESKMANVDVTDDDLDNED